MSQRVPLTPVLAVAVLIGAFVSNAGSAFGAQRLPSQALPFDVDHLKIAYRFKAGSDGAGPYGPLIADASGNLYGTTTFGGGTGCSFNAGCGTVFKLTPTKTGYAESVLYGFAGGNDGDGPQGGVIMDHSGALYGTTERGGGSADNGTVFKLTPGKSGYTEQVLYRFAGGSDGSSPLGGLVADPSGVLYGTTLIGGGALRCSGGCGIVFELVPSGSGYRERILHRFTSGSDGATPADSLLIDAQGALYGTAATGGVPSCAGSAPINRGCGNVFELTAGKAHFAFSVLHEFRGGKDGENPFGTLAVDDAGAFYGTTEYGGLKNLGTVFKLTPSASSYAHATLHQFSGPDGEYVLNGPSLDSAGNVYGTATYGGTSRNAGTVFELSPTSRGYAFKVLHRFTDATGNGGANSLTTPIVVDAAGDLVGATNGGGSQIFAGTIFEVKP